MSIHVTSLNPTMRAALSAHPVAGLCAPQGAAVVLGATEDPMGLALPVAPSDHTFFGPRGACALPDGSLWVADTGHHRVMGFLEWPTTDSAKADVLIGQPDFSREGRNGKAEVHAASLNVPTGIAALHYPDAANRPGQTPRCGLVVADAWNHRVLIWRDAPTHHNTPADMVLGQADFSQNLANRGLQHPTADSLHWPYCVAWDGQRLWVADTGNRRVLMWQGLPTRQGQPADLVLGQRSMECRDENAGHDPDAASMRWPHAICFVGTGLVVADAGNNRLMVWRGVPTQSYTPCDLMLGQHSPSAVDHNLGAYYPEAAAVNMPYGACVAGQQLVVADTANSRLMGWDTGQILQAMDDTEPQRTFGLNAQRLAAQPHWQAKGDNRWKAAQRDSVCWPYSVAYAPLQHQLLVADSGNNRILLWPLVAETGDTK